MGNVVTGFHYNLNNNALTEFGDIMNEVGSNENLKLYNANPNGFWSTTNAMNFVSNTLGTIVPFILAGYATGGLADLALGGVEAGEEALAVKGLPKLLEEPPKIPTFESPTEGQFTRMASQDIGLPKDVPTSQVATESIPQKSLVNKPLTAEEEAGIGKYQNATTGETPINNINHTGEGIKDFLLNAENKPLIRQHISSFLDSAIWSQMTSRDVYNNVREQAFQDALNSGLSIQEASSIADNKAISASNKSFMTQMVLNNSITLLGHLLPFSSKYSGGVLEKMIKKNPELENDVEGMLGGIDAAKQEAIKTDRLKNISSNIWNQTQGALHMIGASVAEKAGMQSGEQQSFQDIENKTNNTLFTPTGSTSFISNIIDEYKKEFSTQAGLSDAAKGLFLGIGMDIIHTKIPYFKHPEFTYDKTNGVYNITKPDTKDALDKNGNKIIMPGKPILDKDGNPVIGPDGKVKKTPDTVKKVTVQKQKLYSSSQLDKFNRRQYFNNAFDAVKGDLSSLVNSKKAINDLNSQILNAKDENERNKLISLRDKHIDKIRNNYILSSIRTGDSRYLHNTLDSILNIDNTTDINKEMREEANKNVQTLQDQLNNETDPEKQKELQDSLTQAQAEADKFKEVKTKAQLLGYADDADVDENGNISKDKDEKYVENQKMAKEYKDNLSKYEDRYKVYDKIINRKKTFEGNEYALQALAAEIEHDRAVKDNENILKNIPDSIKNDPNDINNPNNLVLNHIKNLNSLSEKIRFLNILKSIKKDANGNIDFNDPDVKGQFDELKKILSDNGFKVNDINDLHGHYNALRSDFSHITGNSDYELIDNLLEEHRRLLDKESSSDIGITMYQSQIYKDFVAKNNLTENTKEANDAFTKHVVDTYKKNVFNEYTMFNNKDMINSAKHYIDTLVNDYGRNANWKNKNGKKFIEYSKSIINAYVNQSLQKFNDEYYKWFEDNKNELLSERKTITTTLNNVSDVVNSNTNKYNKLNTIYNKILILSNHLNNIIESKKDILDGLQSEKDELLKEKQIQDIAIQHDEFNKQYNEIKKEIEDAKYLFYKILNDIPDDPKKVPLTDILNKLLNKISKTNDNSKGEIDKKIDRLNEITNKENNEEELTDEEEEEKDKLIEEINDSFKSNKEKVFDIISKLSNKELNDDEKNKLNEDLKNIPNGDEIKKAVDETLDKLVEIAKLGESDEAKQKEQQVHEELKSKLEELNKESDIVNERSNKVDSINDYINNLKKDIDNIISHIADIQDQYDKIINNNKDLIQHIDDLKSRFDANEEKIDYFNKLITGRIDSDGVEIPEIKELDKFNKEGKEDENNPPPTNDEDDNNPPPSNDEDKNNPPPPPTTNDKKVNEAESKVNEAESKVNEAENKVKEAENKVKEAESKSEEELKKAQEEAKKVQEELKKAQEEAKKAQEELKKAQEEEEAKKKQEEEEAKKKQEEEEAKKKQEEAKKIANKAQETVIKAQGDSNNLKNLKFQLLELKLNLDNLLHRVGNSFHYNELNSFKKFLESLEKGKKNPTIEDNIKRHEKLLNEIKDNFNKIKELSGKKNAPKISQLNIDKPIVLLHNDFYKDMYNSFSDGLKKLIDNPMDKTDISEFKKLIKSYKENLELNIPKSYYQDNRGKNTQVNINRLRDLTNKKNIPIDAKTGKIVDTNYTKNLIEAINEFNNKSDKLKEWIDANFPNDKEINEEYQNKLNTFYKLYQDKLKELDDAHKKIEQIVDGFEEKIIFNSNTTLPTYKDTKDKSNNQQVAVSELVWDMINFSDINKNQFKTIEFRIPTKEEFNNMRDNITDKQSPYKLKEWDNYFNENGDGTITVKEDAFANDVPFIREINGEAIEWLETPDNRRSVSYDSKGAYEQNYNLRKNLKEKLGKIGVEKISKNINDIITQRITTKKEFDIPKGERADNFKYGKFVAIRIEEDGKIRNFGIYLPQEKLSYAFNKDGTMQLVDGLPVLLTNSKPFIINNAKLIDSTPMKKKLFEILNDNSKSIEEKTKDINNSIVMCSYNNKRNTIILTKSGIEIELDNTGKSKISIADFNKKLDGNKDNDSTKQDYVTNISLIKNSKSGDEFNDMDMKNFKQLIEEHRIVTDLDPQSIIVNGEKRITISANPTIHYDNDNSNNIKNPEKSPIITDFNVKITKKEVKKPVEKPDKVTDTGDIVYNSEFIKEHLNQAVELLSGKNLIQLRKQYKNVIDKVIDRTFDSIINNKKLFKGILLIYLII